MHTPRVTCDFETRSEVSLKKCGTWRYSVDPSTDILCLAFRLPHWEHGRTGLWHPGFPSLGLRGSGVDSDLWELFDWIAGNGLVEAHNAFFERCIWGNILTPRYGFPEIAHPNWRCSAAKAAAHALPRGLDDALAALGLEIRKDKPEGKVMQRMSKPRRSRKKEREEWDEQGIAHPVVFHLDRVSLESLFAYCRQDVLAEEALSQALPDLSEAEQEIYSLDQEINLRGFQVDAEAVKTALRLISSETTRLNSQLAEMTAGAVGKATQRAQLLTWLKSQGVHLPDTTKESVSKALAMGTYTSIVKDTLLTLQALGKSSTAKYTSMATHLDPSDSRVRGGLLYHGASTGRWSGSGVQPHNFPKGALKSSMEATWAGLLRGEPCEDIMGTLSSALRGAITATPGRTLFVADYASIECRVLLWLAGDEPALAMFREGKDLYLDMASAIYGREITKNDKEERALGKVAILGCLGANTPVLTQRGWVPITSITSCDKVWDGIEWVEQDGCVAQGKKEVHPWLGIEITPDHRVWDGSAWSTVAHLEADESMTLLQSALASVNLPLPDYAQAHGEVLPAFVCDVLAGHAITMSSKRISEKRPLLDVIVVPKSRQKQRENIIGATRRLFRRSNIGNVFSTVLAPSVVGVRIPTMRTTKIMGDEGYTSFPHGWEQGEKRFWPTWLRFPVGMMRIWSWIGKTMTKDINRVISDSLLGQLTYKISVKFRNSNNGSLTWKPVYDLVNAGPRQRFTILTEKGPLLVHNCGYQMGAGKFVSTAMVMGGVEIDDEMSEQVVQAYRSKYWRVKNLWWDMEAAAIRAVSFKGVEVPCGKVTWIMPKKSRFLYCVLPSGRKLAYPDAEVQPKITPWGEVKPSLTYMGINPFNRKWQRQTSYGGLLVENVTQAVSRDLMAEALLRVEASGIYEPVLSVHDEVIAEEIPGMGGDVRAFEDLVATLPSWAEGCPVEAEGWKGFRYRK